MNDPQQSRVQTALGGPEPSGSKPAIALVQYDADRHFGEREINLANLEALTLEAIAAGANIIVHPEGSTCGYASPNKRWCAPSELQVWGPAGADVSTVAEPIPGGPTTAYWQALARTHGVYIVYHLPEAGDAGRYYTTLGVVGPAGFVTRYRKRLLYHIDEAFASPGREAVVLETPYGRFGLMICLDATYNGPYYDAYRDAGVDAIIVSMDWDDDPQGPYAAQTWFADRARDNAVVIYAADVSPWDGTGKYAPGRARERCGLPAVGVGIDGVSIHRL